MTNIIQNWDTSWASTSISSTSIADGTAATTAALSLDEKSACEVSVTVTYGATATEGVKVYVLRDTDGTNYETVDDKPWGFELAKSSGTTRRRTFTVAADRVSVFKVSVVNDTGDDVTATVRTRNAVVEVA